MPEPADRTPPVVGGRASIATVHRGCPARNGSNCARQLLAKDNLPFTRRAVNLEDPLCEIDSNDGNFHGCRLCLGRFWQSPNWHIAMASEGASTPSDFDN
ncbi:Uncharacterized protein MLTONO_5235 [Mesorhizobium loti]|nr:Uncharacterized protein MLTONO_5235 [Mesorhizobium loti]